MSYKGNIFLRKIHSEKKNIGPWKSWKGSQLNFMLSILPYVQEKSVWFIWYEKWMVTKILYFHSKIVLVMIWRNRSTFEFLCPSPLEWTLQAGICLRRQILPPHSPAHSPPNPEENKSNAKIDDGKNCLEKEILLSIFNVFLLINE